MIIYYDSYCNMCKTSSTLWKKMDWGQKLTFTSFRSMKNYPKTMEEQLHVYDKNKWYQGYSALIQIIKVLPLMWILLPFLYFFKWIGLDRKSTRLNSSHVAISYAVFCLKKKITKYYS